VGELRVEWVSPEEGALLTLGAPTAARVRVTLTGAPAGTPLSVTLSWLSHADLGAPAEPLALTAGPSGEFEGALPPLPLGAHTLVAEARAGEGAPGAVSAQALRGVRADGFVSERLGRLYWDSEPYRAFGVDVPGLLPWLAAQPAAERPARLAAALADLRAAGASVVRVFVGWGEGAWAVFEGPQGFGPGAALLDEVVDEAGRAGLKLTLALLDGSGEQGGFTPLLRWDGIAQPTAADDGRVYRAGTTRDAALALLQLLPARLSARSGRFYRDEMSILGWEVLSRPRWDHLSASDRGQVGAALAAAVGALKRAAPSQLAWTGEEGLDSNPTPYGTFASALGGYGLGGLLSGAYGGAWQPHLSLVNASVSGLTLDTLALRSQSAADWPGVGQAWLRGHALANAARAKPLIVSSSRMNRQGVAEAAQLTAWRAWSAEALSQGAALFILGEVTLSGEAARTTAWPLEAPATRALLGELAARWRAAP